uniref:TFIID subunit TAF5 NTD2 domain-containing protein n=1 Tax=Ciona savignyi TaxID=51511 RepID=H2Z775_CIOSA
MMKRSRTEHIQNAVLNYLKHRNYTDSETTFKQNFKFEETLQEMTTRVLRSHAVSNTDSISFSVGCLDEYFLSFQDLKTFVEKLSKQQKESKLKDILFPIFVQSFFELLLADRSTECRAYLRRFSGLFSQSHQLVVKQLESLSIPLDQSNFDLISGIRKEHEKVVLSDNDQSSLKTFLKTQDNLLLLKIINDRIQILDPELDDQLNLVNKDFAKKDSSPHKAQPSTAPQAKVKVTPLKTRAQDLQPIIISPPSVPTTTTVTPTKPSIAPPVDTMLSDLTIEDARKVIDAVRNSPPTIKELSLVRFNAEGLIHATPSNDHSFISTGFENSTIKLWRQGVRVPDSRSSLPDVSHVNLGCDDLEDVKERLTQKTQRDIAAINDERVVTLRGHSGPVYDSCFTSDNRFLLSCAEDSTVRLWDLQDMRNKVLYEGHNQPVWCIGMSAYDLYFATGSADHTARLWSVDRTFPLRSFAGHQDSVEAVAFHGNCSYLATADRVVRVWDVNSGKSVRVMTGHWAPVMSLAFSSNGRMLASAGADYRVRLWDVASGSLMKEMRAHTDTVYSLAFNYDGSLLASCGADSSVYCWNTASIQATGDQKNQHLVAQWSLNASMNNLLKLNFISNNKLFCYGNVL